MTPGSAFRRRLAGTLGLWIAWSGIGCAARGHIATPGEIDLLRRAQGLTAAGRLTLSGPRGKFSARVVFGVARPDSLRIEIPAASGLRFLLVSRNGVLRADLPGDDAMYEGRATGRVVSGLFGIDVEPIDLVSAILGTASDELTATWRFEGTRPTEISVQIEHAARLTLALDEPLLEPPGDRAFEFGPPRGRVWTLQEMSSRLGLKR